MKAIMARVEKIVGFLALALSISGAALGVLSVMAVGMSNVPDIARADLLYAFILPPAGLVASIITLILAYRRRRLRGALPVTIPALVISLGVIALLFVIWKVS